VDEPAPVRDFREAGLEVMVPSNCLEGDGSYDLVVHFHGAPSVMKAALSQSELNAALLVVNAGEISGDYADRYSPPGMLDWLLGRAQRVVSTQCPAADRRLRRLALSAWSAGFAAVAALLRSPEVYSRTDAVLLADGLHSALISRSPRALPPDALAVFKPFARASVDGQRYFALTHSAVPTDTYASTTECTNHLLAYLGIERVKEGRPGPLPDMWLDSSARRGGFLVEGYAGGDEHAHSQHLWAIGDTLFRRLRDYWAGAIVPPTASAAPSGSGSPIAVSVEVQGNMTCTKSGHYVECRDEH
jgi:hypothetical protein